MINPEYKQDEKKLKEPSKSRLATVIEEAPGKGIKIKIDGEDAARETYYNGTVKTTAGDRVFISYYSGTVIISGKLLY